MNCCGHFFWLYGKYKIVAAAGGCLYIHKFLNKPWRARGRWHENRTRVKNIHSRGPCLVLLAASEILFACVCLLSHETKKRLWWEGERKTIQLAVVPHYMLCCSNRCVGATAAAAATAQRAFFLLFQRLSAFHNETTEWSKDTRTRPSVGRDFLRYFSEQILSFLFFC